MRNLTLEEKNRDLEAKRLYKGRYYYRLAIGMNGFRIIRVDKVERTIKFKKIRKELEHKIAERYMGKREEYYDCDYSLGGLPSYAWECDKWVLYHIYKSEILMEDYGIDYLNFIMLNPNR